MEKKYGKKVEDWEKQDLFLVILKVNNEGIPLTSKRRIKTEAD